MITETLTETEILVVSPYNKEFLSRARDLGGRWRAAEKAWAFPLTRAPEVRELCNLVFGAAPAAPGTRGLTVRLTALRDLAASRDGVRFAGRAVISAGGRDTGASPGAGCALISGKVKSGGSNQYWETFVDAGCVVEVENVPPAAAVSTADWSVEILGETAARSDRTALLAERERLETRLAAIALALGESERARLETRLAALDAGRGR